MSETARRVVLLARPGGARDRMREALDQAGANIVLEADPTATEQDVVLAAKPEVALVVLDAATDEALDRFEGLLADPKVEVFFEEAELAVGRVGWDAARWVRHLSAKLRHSQDVLPPGRNADSQAPHAQHTQTQAAQTPVAANGAVPPPLPPYQAPEALATARPAAIPVTPPPLPPLPDLPVAAEPAIAPTITPTITPIEAHGDMGLAALEFGDDARHSVGTYEAGTLPALGAKFELELVDETPTEIRIEGLELEGDHPVDARRFQDDMDDLHRRIASMQLVEDESPARVRGAVLILAGIGGPDAVRQLLGALPEGFPQPVLVQQRLDGGHYDKLVAQMQRATTLSVRLATAGEAVEPATVYIVPPSVGLEDTGSGLRFTGAPIDLLAVLPAGDSAVLLLSGSDPTQVDTVMKLAAAGAVVAAQALDGCYDVAAPAALAARGGQVGKPPELALRLAQRWH